MLYNQQKMMFYFSRLVSDLLCPDEYVVILCYSHMYLIHQRQSDVVSCKYAACIDLVMKRMVPRGEKQMFWQRIE